MIIVEMIFILVPPVKFKFSTALPGKRVLTID